MASPTAHAAEPIARAGVGLLAVERVPTPAPARTAPARQPEPEPEPAPARAAAIGLSASLRYLDRPELDDTIARLRQAGVRYSREDIIWATVEAVPGVFDWSSFDKVVRESARRGLRLIAIPSEPPEWATGASNVPPTSGDALEAFTAFVRASIERYGSNGTFWTEFGGVPKVPITMWDIWNEPYQPQFWGNERPDPAAYARMFRRVVQGARDVDPKARFMLEAETGNNGYPWPQPPYLGAMFEAEPGLAKDIDVVSVHPYSGTLSPSTCTPDPPSQGIRTFWQATRFQFCRVRDVREILDRYGATGARIWITEIGYTTAPGADRAVSEAQQAEYLRDIFAQLRDWKIVDGIVWYHYRLGKEDPADEADWYGLVHPDGTPKPAWDAFLEETRKGLTAAP